MGTLKVKNKKKKQKKKNPERVTLPICDQYQSSSEIYTSRTAKACTETQADCHINSTYLVVFHAFLSFAEFFQNQLFRNQFFQEYHQSVSNSLDPDQA